MFCFPAHPVTPAEAKVMAAWRYVEPYSCYAEPDEKAFLSGRFFCFSDEMGEPAAFFTYGEDARVPMAEAFYTKEPELLDLGLGLRPDLTGQGWGLMLVESALAYLREACGAQGFRLAVYVWNERAIRVYRRAGFEIVGQCGQGDDVFLMMVHRERPWREASRSLQEGMDIYSGDPKFERRLFYTRAQCGYDLSVFTMSAHAGTHIDAPLHVGLPGDTEAWPLGDLNRTVQLLDLSKGGTALIQSEELAGCRGARVLLRTCGDAFPRGRPLSEAAAEFAIAAGVRMVGVDGLSVGDDGIAGHRVHCLLLAARVLVLENAALEGFATGWYDMRCLPLLMPGSDGAPVRLWLRGV